METNSLLKRLRSFSTLDTFKITSRNPWNDDLEVFDQYNPNAIDALDARLKILRNYTSILAITEYDYHATRDLLRHEDCYSIEAHSLDIYGGQIVRPFLLFKRDFAKQKFTELFPQYIR